MVRLFLLNSHFWNSMFIIMYSKKTYACMKSQNRLYSTYKLQSSLVGFVVFGGKTSFGFLHQWSDIYHFFLSSNAYEERLDWCIFVRLLIFLFPSWKLFFHEIDIYVFFQMLKREEGKWLTRNVRSRTDVIFSLIDTWNIFIFDKSFVNSSKWWFDNIFYNLYFIVNSIHLKRGKW